MVFNYKQSNLPTKPGCYLYKNKRGEIIYVGKAKNLRKRVASYFTKKDLDYKTKLLVKNISDLEFIVTDTEVEALLLEAKLIKQHRPKFNIDLKDSERYAYIKITDEKFPRIVTARQKTKDGQYFGPFTDGARRKTLQYLATRLFKIRTCKNLPKKVCLNYHLGLCDGPCAGLISESAYRDNLNKARLILKSKTKLLVKQLTAEMKIHSLKHEFEQAKELRDQLLALSRHNEKQKISLTKTYNQDVINFIFKDNETLIQMFNIQKGIVSNRQSFHFKFIESIEEFIKQYYYANEIPGEIIIPRKLDDQINIEKYLSKLKKTKVIITAPEKGVKLDLLNLVLTNLKENLTEDEKVLLALKDWLNLPNVPTRVECFDISNLGQTHTVGSMVHFFNAQPDKNNYRRFKIKTVIGQDDFAMMAEVVRRRYSRLIKENAALPDLIIIDGGPGQLHAAVNELEKLNLKLPIISLAKKFEEIYQPGIEQPRRLPANDVKLKLLQKIRDEAHRFAVKYHRLLREKNLQ
jgi:excinuclease ABC subunit C